MAKQRVTPQQLGRAMSDAIGGIEGSANDAIRDIIKQLPLRAQSEAARFYPSVLNVDTGHLRRSTEGFSRIESPMYFLGLKNKMDYAGVHEGGSPDGLNRKGNRRGMGMKARRFMSKPLRKAAKEAVSRMLKHIGFKK